MTRPYPDRPIERLAAPPLSFADRDGREIAVHAYGDRAGADGEGDPVDEFEALVDMYVAFDPADRAQGIPPSGEERVRDWLERILVPEAVNVVAWHDGAAVGHATLVPDQQDAYELAIFVLDSYQEAGIGTHLIEGLLGQGQREGVERVWLTVEPWNRPAIGLYEKVGFEPTDAGGFEAEMSVRLQ